MNMSVLDEEPIYFRDKWNEITVAVDKYYVVAYPLDIYETDTICIRVYTHIDKADEHECGNGLWIDSDMGIVNGNNELYFEDVEDQPDLESKIIKAVFDELQEIGVL